MCAGDAWDAFLLDTSCQPPYCDAAAGRCGTPLASLFFLPFMLLCCFLLLSVLVAVVVEAFKMTRDPPKVSQGPGRQGMAGQRRAGAQLLQPSYQLTAARFMLATGLPPWHTTLCCFVLCCSVFCFLYCR